MLIGLTGNMAAGKSTVADALRERGFTVIDADGIAHELLRERAVVIKLSELFGSDILDKNGGIDRARLASAAFSSEENTKKLNLATHPLILTRMLRLAGEAERAFPGKPVFCDVPLLFETRFDMFCDMTLVVASDDETRYKRIELRDGLTREQAKLRINRQMPQDEKIRRADIVIMNDGAIGELYEKVDAALYEIDARIAERSGGAQENADE